MISRRSLALFVVLAAACEKAYPDPQTFAAQVEPAAAKYTGGFGDTAMSALVAPVPSADEASASPAPPPLAEGCDPNYDPCVPVAADVDCPGGGGNGPAYAPGPVTVVGRDVYDLDRDGDGRGCDR